MSQSIRVCSPSAQRVLHDHQLEQAHHLGIRILSLEHPEYLPILRNIPDPPAHLYVKGFLPPDPRGVACVGTRWPTTWGTTVTQRITRMLVEHSYSIISGLALGIDAIAHQTALRAGGHTVAVLPCGLDQIYPARHRYLADEIIDQGGALVSEQPFGSGIHPHMFVQRNRIQSGLALGVMVMQCAASGGTIHAARACLHQKRLLCVTSPQEKYACEPESTGNLALLKKPEVFALHSAADYPRLLALLASSSLAA